MFPHAGFGWLFYQYLCKQKCFLASNYSSSKWRHVGSLFTNGEHKNGDLWRIWYLFYTRQSSSWRQRLLGTKWQHSRDFHTSTFIKQGENSNERLLYVIFFIPNDMMLLRDGSSIWFPFQGVLLMLSNYLHVNCTSTCAFFLLQRFTTHMTPMKMKMQNQNRENLKK